MGQVLDEEDAPTIFVQKAGGKLFPMAASVVLEVWGAGGASEDRGAEEPRAL